ncbi:putative addiction module antidote protein [Nitrospira sp. MA-1]|nr:putative addiction module antidote protein [Nitrospira sp. MA-1]
MGQTAGVGAEVKKINADQPDLIESLQDAGEAEEYLNAVLEEGDSELFLLGLRNVAEGQGGVAQLAEKAKVNRESLYKILSEQGNPELKSLDALLHALGFRLAVTANR